MAIEVILWDIDETLLDPIIPERNAIKAAFREFGLGEVSEAQLDHYPEINRRWWRWCDEGKYPKDVILWSRFREFLDYCGVDSSIAYDFSLSYMRRLGDTICYNRNGFETIQMLKGRVRQYIVSNGAKLSQTNKIRNSHMDEYMDGVFISEEVGYEKPAKEFFDRVLESIGEADRDKVMIVGDSALNDMRGGNNGGIRCCWYNPKGKPLPEGIRVDHEIKDLSEVLSLLD